MSNAEPILNRLMFSTGVFSFDKPTGGFLKQAVVCCLAFLIFTVRAVGAQYHQDSASVKDAVKVIRGLTDRRMFRLANISANDLLASERIDRNGKATIVLEQIRTKVAEATLSTDDERAIVWNLAEQTALDFLKSDPNHPRKLLIEAQDALTSFSRGNLIRQEIEAEIVPATFNKTALDHFRLATSKFVKIEKEIERLLPIVRNQTAKPGDLTFDQLINLKNNLRYRLAVINLAKAQLYDSNDRLNQVDALNQVLVRLDEVLTQSNADVPLWWEAQISRARCYRLMNKPQQVDQLFNSLPATRLSTQIHNDVLAEQIQCSVAFKQSQRWTKLINDYEDIEQPSPQLELAILNLFMANATRNQSNDKQQWLTRATSMVGEMEEIHGRYWGRRAEILLVGSIKSDHENPVGSSDLQVLVHQGESSFRKKSFKDAAAAFSKAATFAIDANDQDLAITTTVKLAQCFEQMQQHRAASEKLFAVVDRFPTANLSAAVHLRGCWNLAKAVAGHDQKPLIQRLQNQIDLWPQAESTNQARFWLGKSFQNLSEWHQAIGAYLGISSNSPDMLEATELVDQCTRKWMAEIRNRKTNSEWGAAASELAKKLRDKIGLTGSSDKSEWTEVENLLLLTLVDVGLPAGAVSADDSIAWLDAALSSDRGDGDWRHRALARRAVAIAKQFVNGNQSANLELAVKALPNDAAVMGVCLKGVKENLTDAQLVEISPSIVLICNKAMVDEQVSGSQTWRIEKAIAEVAGGDLSRGINDLSKLAAANPKSLKIQLEYARALTKQGIDLSAAIKQWRRLASKVKKGGDAWYESKYNIAELMIKNDQVDEAKNLIQYLRATSSGFQQSRWKPRFDQLLRN